MIYYSSESLDSNKIAKRADYFLLQTIVERASIELQDYLSGSLDVIHSFILALWISMSSIKILSNMVVHTDIYALNVFTNVCFNAQWDVRSIQKHCIYWAGVSFFKVNCYADSWYLISRFLLLGMAWMHICVKNFLKSCSFFATSKTMGEFKMSCQLSAQCLVFGKHNQG